MAKADVTIPPENVEAPPPITRDDLDAQLDMLRIQARGYRDQIAHFQNQLTMTEGAIQILEHLLNGNKSKPEDTESENT